ncbi:hypothetical protein GOODEAATRI_005771 [Goodea atripinnis]|uniref:Thyroglobulin type-1 domain-containing protein n=1 Tax=Goodea atripinnis TaxID=208336 RepID=A0ABV0PVK4_9TELE
MSSQQQERRYGSMSQSILRLTVSITETVFRPTQTEILQLELIYLSVMKMDSIYHSSPVQCYGESTYCWCVDQEGREVPDVTPPTNTDVTLLYAQGQKIGALPLNRTRLDAARSKTLLTLHGSIVVGIAYDCKENKVYWTDLSLYWTDWNREAPKIETSTVEGQDRRVVVSDGIGLPNALTYDFSSGHICWADAECISPNGSSRRVINSGLNYPFSMVYYSNHFYYSDWRRDGVIAVSKDSSKFTDEYLPEQRSHLYGITIATTHCLPAQSSAPSSTSLRPPLSSADLAQPVVRLGVSYDGLNGNNGLVDLRLQLPQLLDVQQAQDLGCFVQGCICRERRNFVTKQGNIFTERMFKTKTKGDLSSLTSGVET